MNNRVFDLILLVPMAIIIICLVFLISMLIRHEVPKKICIFLYKIYKTNNKKDTKGTNNISIKNAASKEVKKIKKDMKLAKDVLSGKKENEDALINEKTEINKAINKTQDDKDVDEQVIDISIEKLQENIDKNIDRITTEELEQEKDEKTDDFKVNQDDKKDNEDNDNEPKINDKKDLIDNNEPKTNEDKDLIDNKYMDNVIESKNGFDYLCDDVCIQTDDKIE